MVVDDDYIVAILIIVALVVKFRGCLAFNFFGFQTEEVDLFKVKKLSLLEIGKLTRLSVEFQSLPYRYGVLNLFFYFWLLHL